MIQIPPFDPNSPKSSMREIIDDVAEDFLSIIEPGPAGGPSQMDTVVGIDPEYGPLTNRSECRFLAIASLLEAIAAAVLIDEYGTPELRGITISERCITFDTEDHFGRRRTSTDITRSHTTAPRPDALESIVPVDSRLA